jgi:hypothetical protein
MLNRLVTQDGPQPLAAPSAATRLAILDKEEDRIVSQEDESLVADVRSGLTPRAGVRRMLGSREGAGPGYAGR